MALIHKEWGDANLKGIAVVLFWTVLQICIQSSRDELHNSLVLNLLFLHECISVHSEESDLYSTCQ